MGTQVTLNSGSVDSAGSLLLKTNGTTTAVTLDTAQNMGLGVTPSAWISSIKALQLNATGFVSSYSSGTNQNINIGSNSYVDSGAVDRYIVSTYATTYQQYQGQHKWFNAPSGTAGNAITFTQAMTLDASGNLGVGATSPAAPLDVSRDIETLAQIKRTTTTTGAAFLRFNNGGGNYYFGPDSSTGTRAFSSGGAAYGFSISVEGSNPIVFGTANVERARIDSSGNLLVGTTSYADGRINAVTANGLWGIGVKDVFGNNAMIKFVNSSGSQAGSITISGTTTTYGSGSDYRLKDDVQPMQNALDKVTSLRPVTWKWKADGSDGQGFIAHELAEICPDAVYGEKDAVEEDGSIKPQQVDTSFLVATLTAAIQELKADLDATKAELAALKG